MLCRRPDVVGSGNNSSDSLIIIIRNPQNYNSLLNSVPSIWSLHAVVHQKIQQEKHITILFKKSNPDHFHNFFGLSLSLSLNL